MDASIVKSVWSKYGSDEPYWSVLTDPKFKKSNINDNNHKNEFWLSGQGDVSWIKSLIDLKAFVNPKVLDYGCGVGRLTHAWENAEGCDISEPHLVIARQNYPDRIFHLIEPGDCPGGYDIIFSLIVLQHNRPSLMEKCFTNILRALNTNGIAVLHAPYYIQAVHHSDSVMEMNYLPIETVASIAQREGAIILGCNKDRDMCGGEIKNCTYIIKKN